jgi:hypothetical protein
MKITILIAGGLLMVCNTFSQKIENSKIAIDNGFIKTENEPVSLYFPEYFNEDQGLKSTVTIRDLLTMSAGFEWEEVSTFTLQGILNWLNDKKLN